MDDYLYQDEMDKMNIDQLHKAVLQFSNNCFEIKKFCTVILISATTLIATFTKDQLTPVMFIAGVVVVVLFWGLDAQNYYYQELVRARMKVLASNITKRRNPGIAIDGVGMPLDDSRAIRPADQRVFASLFNESMIYYLALAAFIFIAWFILYKHYLWLIISLGIITYVLYKYLYNKPRNN